METITPNHLNKSWFESPEAANERLRAEVEALKAEKKRLVEQSAVEQGANTVDRLILDRLAARKRAHKDTTASERIAFEVAELEIREEAKRQHMVSKETADLSLFDKVEDLATALTRPDADLVEYRINELLLVGHITFVAAEAKAGKTGLLVNRVKSYVDGTPLFGHFHVNKPVTGNVGVWNFELNDSQMHNWFREADIVNRHKIYVLNARGAGLNIQNDLVLERAIQWCRDNQIEVLEIDPLQANFIGSVLKDDDADSYIRALHRLKKEAGISDIVLTTHMGHGAKKDADFDRPIGSARWEGTPDNTWLFKRPNQGDTALLRIDKSRLPKNGGRVAEFAIKRPDAEKPVLEYQGQNDGKAAERELWNEFTRPLLDGELKQKVAHRDSVVGTDAKKRSLVNGWIEEMKGWGILDERKIKDVVDGKEVGQAKLYIQLSETGVNLLTPEYADNGSLLFIEHGRVKAYFEVQNPEEATPLK